MPQVQWNSLTAPELIIVDGGSSFAPPGRLIVRGQIERYFGELSTRLIEQGPGDQTVNPQGDHV